MPSKEKRGRPRKTYNSQLSQAHFLCVEYYFQGYNKTESMLKAGYSETTAKKRQDVVFNRPDVKSAIEERRWAAKSRTNKMIDRIQEELAAIAFFNMGEIVEITDSGELVFNFEDVTMEQMAAIGEVKVEVYTEGVGDDKETVKRVVVKPYDKKAALDSLARIYGLFQDNLAINPGEGGSVEERLAAGRKRLNQRMEEQSDGPPVIDGEYEDVTND